MPWPQWLQWLQWLHVSIHLWPLRLLVPFPFRYSTTHMQAVGRRPQTAPDLWSRVPGAGAREERRGGLRWYPECTQRSVPALPGPHRRKTALSQSHAHHSIHTHCRADRYAASPRNEKPHPTHYQAPGRGSRGPTRERDGTKQPSLVSQSPCPLEVALAAADYLCGFCDEVPRADSGGPAHRAHPSCWVTPTDPSPLLHPSSLTQPTSPHPPTTTTP